MFTLAVTSTRCAVATRSILNAGDQLDQLRLAAAAVVRQPADQIPDAPITVARDRQVCL
jgi:hypothetical protein